MVEVAVKPAATDKSLESWECSESESWSNHDKEVRDPEIQKFQGILKLEAENCHIIFMSPAVVSHMEKVFSIVRQFYGRSPRKTSTGTTLRGENS